MVTNRREFIACLGAVSVAGVHAGERVPETEQEGQLPLNDSHPMLQNAAATSMGIVWAVRATANGFVEYSENPDLTNARKVKCGGFRVTGMNDRVMQVRLTGLKPDTCYYYRVGADRISYKGGYAMKVIGTEIDGRIHSFRTLGPKASGGFCVINDTHARWKPFGMAVDKIAELHPSCVVWNGDACTTQETLESLVHVFLKPQIARMDYASDIPYLFLNGNHDFRGRAARELERVVMFRQPEERSSRYWDLGRNFVQRVGQVALIGLDTGEDKLDDRDVFAGLFNMEPYREAQADWLSDVVKSEEIRTASYVVAMCHIPLFDPDPLANPGDCDKDGGGRYSDDFAFWQRTCARLWGSQLKEAGVQLVIAAHQHKYRYDAPSSDRPWAQIVGGGPECQPGEGRFPTVVQGVVQGGQLVVRVHNLLSGAVEATYAYDPRKF